MTGNDIESGKDRQIWQSWDKSLMCNLCSDGKSLKVVCDVWLHLFDNYGTSSLPNIPPDQLLHRTFFLIFIRWQRPAPCWVEKCLGSRNPSDIVNSWELSASACPPPPWWNEAKYSILERENILISSLPLLRNRAVCYSAVGVVTDLTTREEQIEIIRAAAEIRIV